MKEWKATTAVLLLGIGILSGCLQASQAAQEISINVKVSQAQKGVIGEGEIYTGKIT